MAGKDADLFQLIERGDAAALEAALEGGAEANTTGRDGQPLLGRTAALGNLPALQLLLNHGATVDGAGEAGNTALMEAAARGHLEVVRTLLQAGADPAHRNKWGLGPADWAEWPANAAKVKALIQAGGR